ncbi:MAG: alpha/beta hydrolase family protein [Pseudodonghicola sp.]
MRILALLILHLCLATGAFADTAPPVGFRTLNASGLEAKVWYPTASTAPITRLAENPVFVGVPVVEDAPVAEGLHPVALLSHGYSGLWRNQAWLAEALAQAGYIAVAFDHPGTSFGNMEPDWAAHLVRRPQQVSQVLDTLLADATFGARVDHAHISVIGHSLGGSTALFLAGAVFDPARLFDACGDSSDKIVCTLYRTGGLAPSQPPVSARDPRVTAIVLLDMEGIRAFAPDSLAGLPVPVLALVSGVEDPGLPLGWEGRAQSALLPPATSRYAEVIGATHFSFMSLCKPGAEALLGDDAYVCQGETVPRAELHRDIARTVINFLRSDTRLVSRLQSL